MHTTINDFFSTVFVLSAGLLISTPAMAQQKEVAAEPAAAEHKITPAQVDDYIKVVSGEIERAEGRVKSIRAQLISIDDDIESLVNRTVSLLSSTRDSNQNAGTRVRMMKKKLLDTLEKSMKYYAQERDKRQKEMSNRYARIDNEELANDVDKLNKRIDTRISQTIEITASLRQTQEAHVGAYRNWDYDSGKTTEFKKGQKDASASVKMKADLIAKIRAAIERLTRENETRENELRITKDSNKQQILNQEIVATRQIIDIRRDQIEKIMTSSKPTRPVNSKAAFETDKLLEEMFSNLRKDFLKFRSLVGELDAARARIKPLKARLAKAQAYQAKM